MRLNLGCGPLTMPGWVNVDQAALPGVDLVWDLDRGPWPWDDCTAEAVEAKDVFEHVNDAVLFMCEVWRVLAPGCDVHLHTPNVLAGPGDAFTDPTHRRFPTPATFDYWVPGTVLYQHNPAYGGVSFSKRKLFTGPDGALDVTLRKMVV